MPLRDHFRPPVETYSTWEEVHGGLPMMIVVELAKILPKGYRAGPLVTQGGALFELDVAGFKTNHEVSDASSLPDDETQLQPWADATLTAVAEMPESYEYEVMIYDARRARKLVAAIELVSPANKDRPKSREAFVNKCSTLIAKGVCVSIVDFVTVRRFNLYREMLDLVDLKDPVFAKSDSPIYLSTTRQVSDGSKTRLESWSKALAVGQPLPPLPIWLSDTLKITLDLETAYEETCRPLGIV